MARPDAIQHGTQSVLRKSYALSRERRPQFRLPTPARLSVLLIPLCFCLAVLSPPRADAAEERIPLAITGVRDDTRDPGLQDALIAEGLNNLIAEKMYATGRYVPLEASDEILEQMRVLAQNRWFTENFDETAMNDRLADLNCKASVFGVISKLTRTRSKVRAGIFSSARTVVTVEVTLVLNQDGQPERRVTGGGQGVTTADAAFFKISDKRIHFDQTSLGQAFQAAIEEAVDKLTTP